MCRRSYVRWRLAYIWWWLEDYGNNFSHFVIIIINKNIFIKILKQPVTTIILVNCHFSQNKLLAKFVDSIKIMATPLCDESRFYINSKKNYISINFEFGACLVYFKDWNWRKRGYFYILIIKTSICLNICVTSVLYRLVGQIHY